MLSRVQVVDKPSRVHRGVRRPCPHPRRQHCRLPDREVSDVHGRREDAVRLPSAAPARPHAHRLGRQEEGQGAVQPVAGPQGPRDDDGRVRRQSGVSGTSHQSGEEEDEMPR